MTLPLSKDSPKTRKYSVLLTPTSWKMAKTWKIKQHELNFNNIWLCHIRAASWQIQTKWLCAQRRLRSAWASAKDPNFLHTDSEDSDQMGGCPGWCRSWLGAHAILLVLSCGGSYANKQKHRSACTSAQSDQGLFYSLPILHDAYSC